MKLKVINHYFPTQVFNCPLGNGPQGLTGFVQNGNPVKQRRFCCQHGAECVAKTLTEFGAYIEFANSSLCCKMPAHLCRHT